MDRIILHSDFNGFFAAVECYLNPKIAHLPVAVVGDPDKRHGIVLAKNGIAKQYGVSTGETIWSAQRKCPDLHLVPPHFDEYLKFSQKAFKLYNSHTPFVEPFGLDECWLDISSPKIAFKDAENYANMLREQVKSEIGITVSVGVSFTKSFAKLASDLKKPDAVSVISGSNYKSVAWKLPCEALLYVGRSTKSILNSHGIYTIGNIANCPEDMLVSFLGKSGHMLYSYANGLDTSKVAYASDSSPAKSIGNSTTLDHDLTSFDEVEATIYALADKVASRLRASYAKCSLVHISIKDSHFMTVSRQTKLQIPTNITNEIAEAAMSLFNSCGKNGFGPIRALGVQVSGLISADSAYQTSFFDNLDRRIKQAAIDSATDKLRSKYGFSILGRASTIESAPKDTHCFLRHHAVES